MSTLREYFDAMVPLLRGELAPCDFESRVGPVTPTIDRIAFYRTLMRRNACHSVEQLFPATRRAWLSLGGPSWDELIERFDREFPLGHWDPNQFGAAFPSFLSALSGDLPAYLEQVADFEWICFVVTYAGSEPGEIGLEGRLQVRSYDYDVPAFVLDATQAAPQRALTRLFVFRSFEDQRARYRYASPAELAALARRLGSPRTPAWPEAILTEAERRLTAAGVLPQAPELT